MVKGIRKTIFVLLGSVCVLLGFMGMLAPVLPTTPFLLLAVFFFARGSDRALNWLLHNRWCGAYIRNYREGRGMTLRDKVVTLLMLWITILFSATFLLETWWVRVLLLVIATGVTLHLARIRTCRSGAAAGASGPAVEGD